VIDGGIAELDPSVRARLLWLRARALQDLGRRDDAARSLREALARPELLAPQVRREARTLAARLGIDAAEGGSELP
jgi:SOS response regulatory protein OraA/RecX